MKKVPGSGAYGAKIMLVGEAPGVEEEAKGLPFVGASGHELTRMLGEAGISRDDCYITNVCKYRPPYNDIEQWIAKSRKQATPQHVQVRGKMVLPQVAEGIRELKEEIAHVRPNLIVAFGGSALWALTGEEGILKWRGSLLYEDLTTHRCKLVPTVHPAAITREWPLRAPAMADLRRAAHYTAGQPYPVPGWRFITRPSFPVCQSTLQTLLDRLDGGESLDLSTDIETRLGHIACIGIAWSLTDAICIPLMVRGRASGYWSEIEETRISYLLHRLLRHARARVIGQNFLYDAQYFWRWLKMVPMVEMDTMIAQHAIFSELPKSLAFLASLYCKYYVFWKDEGKTWQEAGDEDQLWTYNCRDCVYTLEVYYALCNITERMHANKIQTAQQTMFWPVLEAMKLGVKIDQKVRADLKKEVSAEIAKRKDFLAKILGHPINPNSPKQMQALFYEDLKLPVQMTRAHKGKMGHATLNDDALQTLARKEPLVKPIINAISDIRTLNIFLSTFIEAPLDWDGRMRCSYNVGGSASGKSAPKTYRLSSSTNAFGGGANLQTIPSAKSKSSGKFEKRGGIAGLGDPYHLPDLRRMFIPDEGKTFFNGDLDRADLQVVAWEAEDEDLKAILRLGADMHLANAYVLAGREPPPYEDLVERHKRSEPCTCPRTCYWEYRSPLAHAREFAKVFCHATNYVGSPRTIASHVGRTVREVDSAQRLWFGAHPGIKRWHNRVLDQITRKRYVENRFGYRWYIFDRLDNILPEAVAWIPQSTVSLVINRIWSDFFFHLFPRDVWTLLQVHDSLAGQFPTGDKAGVLQEMARLSRVVVPYEDPLEIPFNITTSEVSWGDC